MNSKPANSMIRKPMSRRQIALFAAIIPLFMGCQVEQSKKIQAKPHSLPPLSTQFACLPANSALIAAHRGTSRDMKLGENALPSLKKLVDGGILMAEIDVAGLKDGVHILFHDGIWDDDSTGKGVVAASNWNQASNYLLRDNQGRLTSMAPPRFDDVLDYAKGRLYLEIDFKSSAKYDYVIKAIRNAGMSKDVILIAYTEKQAAALARRAPDMIISGSIRENSDINRLIRAGVKRENIAAWVGTVSNSGSLEQTLNEQSIPILALGRRNLKKYAKVAKVVVSDYALSDKARGDYPGIIGLTRKSQTAYEACLVSKSTMKPET